MDINSQTILEAALLLPEQERLDLAAQLLDATSEGSAGLSLDDPEFMSELERRFNDGSQGTAWSELRLEK